MSKIKWNLYKYSNGRHDGYFLKAFYASGQIVLQLGFNYINNVRILSFTPSGDWELCIFKCAAFFDGG